MVGRRGFLKALLALPIAATLDVEKLLWVPGQMVTVPAMPLSFHPDAFRLVMGDVFTIGGRFVIHPQTRRPIEGQLQQFVVTHVSERGHEFEMHPRSHVLQPPLHGQVRPRPLGRRR